MNIKTSFYYYYWNDYEVNWFLDKNIFNWKRVNPNKDIESLFNYFIDIKYFYYKEYDYTYILITNDKRKGYILRKYSSISCNKMIN